jgi:hypothetical protein
MKIRPLGAELFDVARHDKAKLRLAIILQVQLEMSDNTS